MTSVDALTNSLFFSANLNNSKKIDKKDEKKISGKKSFKSVYEKEVEVSSLILQGLPAEIAGLSVEESIVYLKDKIDISAEELENNFSIENYTEFRKSVGHFMKFISKNNYEVIKHKRPRKTVLKKGIYFSEKRELDPFVQINVIDKKLEELAGMILQNYGNKINMLAKVNEIKGLIVDFYAD